MVKVVIHIALGIGKKDILDTSNVQNDEKIEEAVNVERKAKIIKGIAKLISLGVEPFDNSGTVFH